jgi:hypothetical protein
VESCWHRFKVGAARVVSVRHYTSKYGREKVPFLPSRHANLTQGSECLSLNHPFSVFKRQQYYSILETLNDLRKARSHAITRVVCQKVTKPPSLPITNMIDVHSLGSLGCHSDASITCSRIGCIVSNVISFSGRVQPSSMGKRSSRKKVLTYLRKIVSPFSTSTAYSDWDLLLGSLTGGDIAEDCQVEYCFLRTN